VTPPPPQDALQDREAAPTLFRLPRSFRRNRFLALLRSAGYAVIPLEESNVRDLYWDTQDGRLHQEGQRLRHREANRVGLWQLCKGGILLAEFDAARAEVPPRGPLAETLEPLLKGRSPLPQLRIRARTARYDMQGPGEARFELTLHLNLRLSLPEAGGSIREAPRLSAVLWSGEPREARHLTVLLRDRAAMVPEAGDLFEAALRVLNLPPPGAPLPGELLVLPEDSAAAAGRKILAQQLFKMRANLQGTLRDLDVEFLHDLRVATRRARSALQFLGEALGPARSRSLRAELGWVARVLGEVRDMDVFVPYLLPKLDDADVSPEGREWILDAFHRRRTLALESAREALRSRRFAALLNRLDRLASSPPPKRPRGSGGAAVAEMGAPLVRRASRRVLNLARRMGEDPTEEELHRLRIRFKRLRYAGEFFRSALKRDPERDLKLLVKIQDCLGEHQDAVMAGERLRALTLRDTDPGSPPERLLEIGALLQTTRETARLKRARFRKLWARFRATGLAP